MENFKKLPVIALRSMTILPDTMIHFDLIRKKSILAAEQAMSEDQEVFLVTQCHAETEEPQAEDLYQIGCIAKVKQVTKLPDNLVRVLVEGVCRGRLRTLFGEWNGSVATSRCWKCRQWTKAGKKRCCAARAIVSQNIANIIPERDGRFCAIWRKFTIPVS